MLSKRILPKLIKITSCLFITAMCILTTTTANAQEMSFFEDFNGAGVPPNHADYWYKMNEIYPSQSSWEDFIPGDGHVYITVDNSSSWGDYQGLGIGWIPIVGRRMEVRMKGAILPGYVGFIFTYASSADEIDIELLADDTQGEGGVHDPYAWSDARFNTTDNGQNWNSNFQGIVDDTGSKASHFEDDTYHTYTIDHFGDKIVFYIDGVYQETCTWSIPLEDSEIILGFRDLDFAGEPNWSGTRTLTIDWLNVQPIDQNSPVAAADKYAIDPNTTMNIGGSGILSNDTGNGLVAKLLSAPEHGTLTLNNNGSFTYVPDNGFVGVDQFVYYADDGTAKGTSNSSRVLLKVGQPVEWQKVDDTNANIAYDSTWGTWEGNPGYISTEHFSETVGGEATFTFTGNQARYYGFKRNDLGFVDILVDGVLKTTLDLYNSSSLYDYLLYETEILPWGEHTITVRVNGSQNPSSSGYEVIIDAFSSIDNGAVSTVPVANFTSSISEMTVDFTDGSTDSNGNIASWAWNFGDGNTSTLQNPSHTYTANNTYTVTLTVTDNDNETNSTSKSITVPALLNNPPNPNPMTWSVQPYMNATWPNDNVATMTASVATDDDGGIEYFFDCVEAPDGGNWNGGEDSGWQASNTFSDWYLTNGFTYNYRVKARDALGNETDWTALATITVSGSPTPVGGTKKSIVFMLDGLRADGIISGNTPNIDKLINGTFGGGAYQGSYAYYAQTIQDKPTSSAYNHVSIMTGVTGDKHGASGNDYAGIAAADYNTYPTYISTLESDNSNLNTAFLVTWGADLGMVSGADYVMGQSDASNVDRAVNIINGTFSDASGDNGTSWAYGTDVDVIALFLDDIDGAGHSSDYSPTNSTYMAEVASVDAQIGQILTAIQNRTNFTNEDWQIIITSDHGGYAGTHSYMNSNSETIPFIVASKSASQGLIANRVINYDAAATVVAHYLGEAAIPANYDGVAHGSNIIPASPANLVNSLVVYLPFNGDFADASGQGNNATIGANSDHDPIVYTNSGKIGGYVEINDFGGGAANASYLTLGNPTDIDFGTNTDFTIITWFRAQADQSGDVVVMGNKDWGNGFNAGVLLLANEESGDDFGLNIADGTLRRDVESIDYSFNEWWFQAVTIKRDGNAVMFVGNPNGVLFEISDFSDDLNNITSALPWNIGQDGTGSYAYNLDADLDEMAIWSRFLSLDEIRQVYNNGAGIDLNSLININNIAPSANFTSSSSNLVATFTDTSSDSDGTIASWTWNFGDGNTSTVQNPSHTYAADGTYTVSLTVTDNEGATNSTSQSITITTTPIPVGDIEIMTWVPSYAITACQENANANFGECSPKDVLTRVGLQFWLAEYDGTLSYNSGVSDAEVAWWTDWGATNGIKILLTVFNQDGTWNWSRARSAFANNRTTFVNSLVTEMERLNLDGIDLDLEGLGDFESDRSAYSQFVTELSEALKSRGKILTIDSFHYIWNAPNINWYSDWLGKVDNIHSMGYDDLYEGGDTWHKYSYQQNAGITAGHDATTVLMGMPDWVANWGNDTGYGTDALGHVKEIRYSLPEGPSGIAIWDFQLGAASWQNSATWCEIAAMKGSDATPTANFTYAATDLSVDFTDTSTDSDGTIVSWVWDFGDESTSTAQSPSYTYAADGTYTITLTVTDNDNVTGSSTQTLTVCLDTDDDGVCDADDICPDTPTGEGVDASGCSVSQLDDDNDGVTNNNDLCPNTPTGEEVDANGCSTCVAATANFTGDQLTGINSTNLTLPENSQDVLFTVNNINQKSKGKPSNKYTELVTVSYTNGVGVTQTYGTFSGANVNSAIIDILGAVQSVTVSLTDELNGSGSNMNISISQVTYCINSTPCTPDSDGDGVCDSEDQCPGLDDALIGTPCDDGDNCTTGEAYDTNCNCSGGIYTDNDGDGFCIGDDPDDNDGCNPDPNSGACSPCGDIISDGFESGFGNWNDGGKDCALSTSNPNTGNYSIQIRDNNGASSSMFTNNLDLSAYTEVTVEFSYYANSMENGEDFFLEISTNGGSSYSIYKSWVSGTDFSNNTRYNESVSITGISFTSATVFRLRCDASHKQDQIYIDDVVITACNSGMARTKIVSKSNNQSVINGNEIKIYPSPASLTLFIKYSDRANIALYNVNGQRVRNVDMNGQNNQTQEVDLRGLSEGLYLLRMTDQNGGVLKAKRIIIKSN